MVEDYSGLPDAEAVPLKAYWREEFNVVFSDLSIKGDPGILSEGKGLHEEYCAACHSKPEAAFLSLPMARVIEPVAAASNRARADIWLYYIHVLACFLGIAYLPFSKFIHILTDPLVLFINGMTGYSVTGGAGGLTLRALELDACTRCGSCNVHCSVAQVFQVMGNRDILPSHKLNSVKDVAKAEDLHPERMRMLAEGSYICTECHKCTDRCPTGINLQDLWGSSKEDLAESGYTRPHIRITKRNPVRWADLLKDHEDERGIQVLHHQGGTSKITEDADIFTPCIQCQTCTNVCPVVACNAGEDSIIDITPQKVINLLRMSLRDLALGTRMVWHCTTCYQCQQHCPQDIPIADIMYELKSLAYSRLRNLDSASDADDSESGD
jgi:heterodisulfide reductase subunit C